MYVCIYRQGCLDYMKINVAINIIHIYVGWISSAARYVILSLCIECWICARPEYIYIVVHTTLAPLQCQSAVKYSQVFVFIWNLHWWSNRKLLRHLLLHVTATTACRLNQHAKGFDWKPSSIWLKPTKCMQIKNIWGKVLACALCCTPLDEKLDFYS